MSDFAPANRTDDVPILSVITAARDAGPVLEACLRSVAVQTEAAVEHIVIDGASTDGSPALLAQVQATWHPRLRWVSEPDQGIADAMNKGVRLARGEWILFLHADDGLLAADVLAWVLPVLQASPAIPLHSWAVEVRGRRVRRVPPRSLSLARWKMPFPHQGLIVHRRLFADHGLFDETLRVCMDYDWVLRVLTRGECAKVHAGCFSWMGGAGISSQRAWVFARRRFSEAHTVQWRHAEGAWLRGAYCCYHPLHLLYRRCVAGLETWGGRECP